MTTKVETEKKNFNTYSKMASNKRTLISKF